MANKDAKKVTASKTATSKKKVTKKKVSKKKTAKKKVSKKTTKKKVTARKATARKATASKATKKSQKISEDERRMMIALHAYYKWENAGFPHGEDHQHWLEAEKEVNNMLKCK